jgi:1-aminocyclopropane-1-carboxylate deaminase
MNILKPLTSYIEAVAFAFDGVEISFYVQRDDLLHPLLSGNKYRKLQAFVQADAIGYVSIGGAWSNHLLAVATMARIQGVKSVGFVRGNENRAQNLYERWLNQLGMELIHLSRETYSHKEKIYEEAKLRFPEYQIVPEGGHPQPHGRAFDAWVAEIPPFISHLILSCGTGASFLGLAGALHRAGRDDIRLLGVSAIGAQAQLDRLQMDGQSVHAHSSVFGPLDGKRFGKISAERLLLAKSFFEQTGIAPDPVYDTHLLAQIVQLHRNGTLGHQDKVLWLHSGGITGWAGYPSECNELFGL